MASDGMIELDTPFARSIGFTSDKFSGWLWKVNDVICISMITSIEEGKGHFGKLCKDLLRNGFTVQIPTPLGRMESIVRKNGYKMKIVPFHPPEIMEPVEVWELSQ